MKKIKNLIITLLIIGFVLFSTSISMAASLTISTSKSEAKEGETVSITVNGSGITGRVNLSATGGTLEESSVWVENSKATVNLTLNGSGDAKVTATPSDVSDSSTGEAASVSSTGATVKLSKDEPTPPAETDSNNNNESNQQNDNEDNNNNNNDNNSSNSNNNSSNNNQTEKRNTETKKSSNANLKNLGINPNDFTGFKSGTTSYSVTVPNDVEKVNVYATAADRNAKVSGTGDRNLNVGSNALNVTVTAEDGTTKTYTINVKREEAKQEEEKKEEENKENDENTVPQGDLTKLEVKGFTLNPQFSPTTYSYKLDVKNDVSKLDISTQARNDKIKVEVVGNENLKEGENIITVLVTNEVTNDNATYQIVVNKAAKSENSQVATNNSISKANKIRKILFILILVFVAVIITGFIIYFRNKKNEDDDSIYEYDEEDLEDNEDEKIDLDEEEEFFKRVNKQKFSVAKEANKMLQDEDKNETSSKLNMDNKKPERIGNIEIKEKKNDSNNMIEEYFRTSKTDKKGKHF